MKTQPNIASLVGDRISLDVAVHRAISEFLNIPPEQIITRPNKEKYYDPDRPESVDQGLQEVFSIMRDLNLRGLEDRDLCRSEAGGMSFLEALQAVVQDFTDMAPQTPVHYVELGPEPIKTTEILQRLVEGGVQIRSYTALDINPVSKFVMDSCIRRFVAAEKINHVTADYFSLSDLGIEDDGARALVTMLGFQEGNETPYKIMNFFRKFVRPGDTLLAEMQLLSTANWLPIFRFYGSEQMRRFSKLSLQRTMGNLESEYGVVLVPVPMEISGSAFVAATTERIRSDGNLNGKIVVTNYCIKYTEEEFRRLREFDRRFHVVSQRVTGDGSVGFQLAERC